MGKVLKWLGIGVAGLLLALVVVVGAFVFLFDWNWLKEPIVARASDATGRQVAIDGDIHGEYSLVPRIRVTGIRVANADWAKETAKDMLSVGELDFRIELLELLRGRVVLPDLVIRRGAVSLEKRRDGTANWEFGPSVAGATAEAAVPENRSEFPIIHRLIIDDSRVTYIDPTLKTDIRAKISSAEAKTGGSESVHIEGEGRYKDAKFDLTLNTGRLLSLRETRDPFPIDFRFAVGKTKFEGKGTALRPLDFDGLEFDLALSGPDLADLYTVTGIPLPPTGAYSLRGRLTKRADIWAFDKFDGRVGRSDLHGRLTVNAGQKIPFMTAKFVSNRLDFVDLGGFVGAPPDKDVPTKGSGRVLPDMKIDLRRLRSMNMRVEFDGKEIVAPNMPINDLHTVLVLRDGRLTLDPLKFGVAGGSVEGPTVFDGTQKVPALSADLTLKALNLKPFFRNLETKGLSSGRIGGKVALKGRGHSLAEVLGVADGKVTLAMVGGTIDPLIVELIGLDIGQALAIVATGAEPVGIRCVLADMAAKNGRLQINGFLADTTDSNIWAEGSVDLGQEKLAVRVEASPKDVSLLSANAPIAIAGSFKDPSIAIDTLATEGEGGIAEAIGKVVNPILALLPFVDVGLSEDTDCHNLKPAGKPDSRRKRSERAPAHNLERNG